MFANLINIITSPKEAFTSLKEKPSVLFPLLFIIIMTGYTQIVYHQYVDRDFFIEQTVQQTLAFIDVSESELRAGLEDTNLSTQGIITAISTAIFIPIMFSIWAGYLTFVTKFTDDEISFKSWYSLATWTSIPLIFTALAGIGVMISSPDGMVSQFELNPLSLNSLFFQSEGSFQTLLNSLDLMQLWGLALIVLGYQHWTGKSMLTSAIITGAPFILIFGIWSLIILM